MDKVGTSPLNVANSLYDTSVNEEAQLLAQEEAQAQQKAQLNIIVETQLGYSASRNPSPGVVTRSQVTASFEHQALEFLTKSRTKKMVVI